MVSGAGCAGAGAGAGGAVGASLAAALQFFAASQCVLRDTWPEEAIKNGSCFNFVIAGGGTAGSMLALRLSEVSSFRVLLLEAGGDPPVESIVPGFRWALKNSEYDWQFQSEGDGSAAALRGRRQRLPRGRLLGGSGSLNDMVYARGFPTDYAAWAAATDAADWGWDSVLPYFKKTEHITDKNILKDPELMKNHGRGGDIEVTGSEEPTFETEKFLKAFSEMGYKIVKDMTSPNGLGAGRFSHTIRKGQRDSSYTALLKQAADRGNLHILKHAVVTNVLIANDTAYGVKVMTPKGESVFFATKEVIISAGAFNTPKLLQLSGVGPKEDLEKLNIEVIKDLPVGKNLHDHVMVLNFIQADNGTCYNSDRKSHFDMIKYLYDRSGQHGQSDTMGAYVSFTPDQPNVPDFAFYPTCLGVKSNFKDGCKTVLGLEDSICDKLDRINQDYELITLAAVQLKPRSRGYVTLKSADPLDAPLIYTGTFSDSRDLEDFPRVFDIVKAFAKTPYFKSKNAKLIDLEIAVCSGLLGADAVRCVARALGTTAWHSAGTAALGHVVDAQLVVRGVRSLRVVDASVMPEVPRGNTNAPVVMIAEKAADFIKKEHLKALKT